MANHHPYIWVNYNNWLARNKAPQDFPRREDCVALSASPWSCETTRNEATSHVKNQIIYPPEIRPYKDNSPNPSYHCSEGEQWGRYSLSIYIYIATATDMIYIYTYINDYIIHSYTSDNILMAIWLEKFSWLYWWASNGVHWWVINHTISYIVFKQPPF